MLVKHANVFFLLVIVGVNCNAGMQLFRPPGHYPYGNSNFSAGCAYDSKTEICCSGVSNPFDLTLSPKCCGVTPYDPSRKVCCNKSVLDLEIGKLCCGDRMIDTSSDMCCDGVSYPRSSSTVRCCNNATYDSTTEVCCPYNEPSVLSKDGDSSRTTCCGDKAYNPTTEACCYSSPRDSEGQYHMQTDVMKKTKPTDQACCGSVTYNYNTNICCGDQLYDNSYFCCGNQEPYLLGPQKCCMDYLLENYEIVDNSLDCCVSKGYDQNKQACCNGKVIEIANGETLGCCGDEFYDTNTEVCCYNYNYNAMPYGYNGTGTYDSSAATTTEKPELVIQKTSSSDNDCCEGVSYNDQEQYCCFDDRTSKKYLAKRLTPNSYQCCGDVVFDFQDGICCGGAADNWKTQPIFHKFEASNQYTLQCCGDQAFNMSSSTCCGGSILDTSDGKTACCGDDKVYNTDTHTCCTDYTNYPAPTKIHDKINSNQCCGVDVYDLNAEMCCANTVYKLKDGLSCCNNQTYDFTTELCCTNDVVSKQTENQNDCCYYYSTQDQYPNPYPANV